MRAPGTKILEYPSIVILSRARCLVIVLIVGCVVLAGCEVIEGPLEYGAGEGGSSTQCAPAEVGESFLFGDHLRSNGVITIDEVEAVGAAGLELLDVWLLPAGGIGSATYPPSGIPEWDDRRPAIGAEVQPGVHVNLVIRVARTEQDDGTIERLAVYYTSGGIQFRKAGTQSYELRESCS